MDVHSKKQRSFNMSMIRAQNTKPEQLIAKILRDLKIPFKSHYSELPGKPDFFIPYLNLVIDIRGCFWHGHDGCRFYVIPKSNQQFWLEKIKSNKRRDNLNRRKTSSLSRRILIIWECEIKSGDFFTLLLDRLTK
jgi:DNA mismatch endonuclease (patch repair protein)